MPLVATPGAPDANAYLTVGDATALAEDDLGTEAEAWLQAEAPVQERAVIRATREIDGYLRSGYPRHAATQALLFPRSIDVIDGDPVIPRDIQLATYQQAIYVLANARVLAAANTRRARGMESASEPSTSYSLGEEAVMSPSALHYLSSFRTAPGAAGSGSGVRTARVMGGLAVSR